jgi:hypothetical protein
MQTLDPGTTGRSPPTTRGNRLWPTRLVADRYSSSPRSIERWAFEEKWAHLGFPKPIYINRRRFWREADLDEFDASRR